MRDPGTVQLPGFAVPTGACDVHMHAFGSLDRYPSVAHPHYTLPDGTLPQYRALMDVLGLDHFVIVQPSFYEMDNSCLLDVLREAGSMARGVVMIEPSLGRPDLDRFHALGVRGVRLDLFKRSKLPLEDIQAYILTIAEKVAPLGWHLQFYAPGWLVRDLIDFLTTLSIDFVIDHMGYMLEEDGLTQADFDRLIALMRIGRCWLKLSAPYRIAKTRGYQAVEAVAQAIVQAAPERAIWGSDWPHIPESGRDTGELLNLLLAWAPDPAVRKLILVDNPARLFGFPTKD
ncbi:amidohydrolase [Sphingomonas koreensis]|nr:amidohydrolase [Sphingomonas koreensis]